MSSRRDPLSTIDLANCVEPNAGLWLDKFIKNLSREDKESHADLAREVASIEALENYKGLFDNWRTSLQRLGATSREAKVQGRMAVGLGADGVLETSLTLHRTYGVPFIPGSALKGLAAAFARHYCGDDWQLGSNNYRVVFGNTDTEGYVTFYDALYVPGSGHKGKALYFDVMTVHHRAYYEGKDQPPADWDDPNPVPFISATGKYLIAVAAPQGCEPWRDLAFEILEQALGHEGVGAKTSSGYGRMKLDPPPVDEDKSKADFMIIAISSIPANKLPGELGVKAGELITAELSAKQKKRVAECIDKRTTELGSRQRKKFEEKSWFASIQNMLKV